MYDAPGANAVAQGQARKKAYLNQRKKTIGRYKKLRRAELRGAKRKQYGINNPPSDYGRA